jgi:hypothetical protein
MPFMNSSSKIRYGATSPGQDWVYGGKTRNPSASPKQGWQTSDYWVQRPAAPAPPAPPAADPQPTASSYTSTATATPTSNDTYSTQISDLEQKINEIENRAPTPMPSQSSTAAPSASAASSAPDYSNLLTQFQIQSQAKLDELATTFGNALATAEAQRVEDMRLLREAQKTYAINQARAESAKNLQIEPGGAGTDVGGTEQFKIRKQSGRLSAAAPLMLATTLNI